MKITCIVDNSTRPHRGFWAEHGLAFLIETGDGRFLFDASASGEVLLHNLEVAQVSPETISALVLSHAHRDHTGGLPALLEHRPNLPIYAHPDLLRERFSERQSGMKSVGVPLDPASLRQRADLRLSAARQEVLPGAWTTGEITPRPEPEGRSPRHFVRQDGELKPDPYRDDQSVVLETTQGLVLICGCCHAGLLNTLLHVRKGFGDEPVAVVGGTHLIAADEAHLQHLIETLEELGPPLLYPNHCTGQKAYVALAQAFGDRVSPCPAGTVLEY